MHHLAGYAATGIMQEVVHNMTADVIPASRVCSMECLKGFYITSNDSPSPLEVGNRHETGVGCGVQPAPHM